MDFHTQEIQARFIAGHLPGSVTIAETDFKNDRMIVAKQDVKFDCICAPGYPIQWPQLLKRPLLTIRQPPCPQYETAHGTIVFGVAVRFLRFAGSLGHDVHIVASST
jgi:hypothetical protein